MKPELLRIAGRTFTRENPFVIAEVAQAHDGSLGTAHAFIDAAAASGADAIKFQTHIAEAESTPSEPWRVRFSKQDKSRYDYWKRTAFTEEQWADLKKHADDRGLIFLSSPFSIEAVDLLTRIGVAAWKVPSGETGNTLLLEKMAETGLPILLSTGMSPLAEIDKAVARVKDLGAPLAVMQCTSSYPCPPEKLGLNMIADFRERYGCPVGLSDHSGTIYSGLAAAALGIELLEVHITLSRQMFGPDVPVSLTPEEFRRLVDGVRFIGKATAHPVDKDALAGEMSVMRGLFTKSVVARTDLPAGVILKKEHLASKKPGTGIPADSLPRLIGSKLRRSVKADELLQEKDLEMQIQ